jgi:hypothetical protein
MNYLAKSILVPENNESIILKSFGNIDKCLIEWILSEDELEFLFDSKIFDEFNKKCGVLIDDYETEWITFDKLEIALMIVDKNIKKYPDNVVLNKLKNTIQIAKKHQTRVGFMF